MRGQAFVAATAMAAALMGLAQPAAAQQYPTYHDEHVANQQQCQQSRNNRTVTGAVIGGIAGALLGREVADRGVRGEGALLGAVVGATAGGAIGRTSAQCAQVPQGSYDPYYGQSYQYNQQDPYRSDDSGLEGGPYRQSGYRDDDYNRDCRMGEQITRDPYGREYREQVMMCRGSDGVWRPDY
ncbi:MAG: glycine zipper family protein [Caulobacterales bacterium]|nr:glycine zipper family protein [Caulobacterales bacterium]